MNRPNRPNRPDNGGVNRPNRPNRPGNGHVNRPHRPNRPDYSRPNPRRDRDRYRRPVRRTTWDVSWGWRRHTRHAHRPLWWLPSVTYTHYSHVPYRYNAHHHNRWAQSMYYHYSIPYNYVYWNTWVRVRHQRTNGYYWHDGYPYYIYNGYRHRYSQTDRCDYELVDGRNNTTERTFHTYSCSVGYDMCSDLRDRMNQYESNYRYFCSEKFSRDNNHNYNWDYSNDFWSDANESEDYGSNDYDDYDFGSHDSYDDYVTDNDSYNDGYEDDFGWEDDWDYN